MPLAVRLLGPIEVIGPDGPALLTGARQRGLLALLALHSRTVVALPRLVDALWGERPPRTAVRSLHSHVSRVRAALQSCGLGDVLLTRDPGYLLALPSELVDVHRFEQSVQAAHAEPDPAAAALLLRDGLALWRGEPLADGEPAGWAVAEVGRLREARLAAFEQLCELQLRLGRHTMLIGQLERELVAVPLRERLVGLLMRTLYRAGRPADALQCYQRLRARLAEELGVDPEPGLRRLHTAILRRDPELDLPSAAHASEPPASAPQASEPPAAGWGGQPPAPAQLPPPAGHFAGRATELAGLNRWRRGPNENSPDENSADENSPDEDTRIVVVSGPGGIGKTAFAVQWAHQVSGQFADGQIFLDLRGHDPDAALTAADVLTHALRSLGVPAERVPATVAEQTALYRSLVHDRRLLVVLDNGGTADQVLPLVPSTAGSLLVVTSRHQLTALAVHHGVRAVRLDVFTTTEALGLVERVLGAERVRAEAGAAAELVRLCGRMPLALRIAAAKLAARPRQPLAELAAELREGDRLDALAVDGDARTVRTVFASAYAALSEPAARLFRLLSTHCGPHFSSYLAAALAGLSHGRARRSVDELAAAHLIDETASGRYRFHDLVRLYARERVAAEEEPEQLELAAGRAVDWYLSIADTANRTLDPGRDRVKPPLRHRAGFSALDEPPLDGGPAAVLALLDSEHDNLTAIVEFAARAGHGEAAWQLTYLLAGYFESRGHWADRVAMGHWGLTAAQQLGDATAQGLMRSGLGVACMAARRFDEALQHLHGALGLMRASGDKRGEGHVHNNLAAAYAELRRFDEAVASFGRALAVHTANGHRHGMTLTLNNLGYLHGQVDDPATSLRHLRRGLDLARADGDTRLEAAILHSTGQTLRRSGDWAAALEHFDRALALRRRIGDRRNEARTLTESGLTRLAAGDPAGALADFDLARRVCAQIGDRHGEATALASMGRAHLAAGDLAAAGTWLDRAVRLRLRVPDGYEEANLHRSLALLALRRGDRSAAASHRELAHQRYGKVNATSEARQLAALTVPGDPDGDLAEGATSADYSEQW